MRRLALFLCPVIIGACGGGQSPSTAVGPDAGPAPGLSLIREADVKADLYALAGDHFRGREAGTLDELKASMWIAERARAAGLEPAGDDGTYFQFWPIKRVRISATSTIAIGSTKVPLRDAVVFSLSTAVVDAPVAIAGDGRAATIGNVDLTGKAVVVQMGTPDAKFPPDVSIRPARYALANVMERSRDIAAKGAAAIIFLSDAVADSGWGFVSNWYQKGSYGLEFRESLFGPAPRIPVIWLKRSAATGLSAGQRLAATLFFEQFEYPSVNVIGKVRGTDSRLAGEYVLFSAHQDHDGIKEPVAGDSIWNGADDNGSVSVGVLAIGRAWAKHPSKRSALFVWHGAEEKGLIGSRYHAEHPVVPRDSIVAVLNADMIGANSLDSAALLGAQPPHLNSRELADMGLKANELVGKFKLDTLWDRPTHPEGWYFRSDHLPYAMLGVPALYFSSLPHPLYHTPLDDPTRINYPKLTRIAQWMYATGWMAANSPERVKLIPGFKLERTSP